MAFIDDVRLDIGDDGAIQRYTDAQLIDFTEKAAKRINRKMYLTGTSDEIAVSASGEVTPATDTFRDIMILQVECMLIQRSAEGDLTSGRAGVVVTDGEQSIDTTNIASLRLEYLSGKHNPCSELEKAIRDELLNRNTGKLVW